MPTYVFDYITGDGPKREAFTLDDDRPVGAQVRGVLADLRERGIMLVGGREDQLSIEWNGVRVDESLTVGALGISAFRPIELRMRPTQTSAIEVRPATRPGAPKTWFVPQAVVSAALTGALGGACAWTLLATLPLVDTPNPDRDALAVVLFVGTVGVFAVLAQHGLTRRLWLGLLGVVLGAPMAAAVSVGLIGAAAAPFVAHRIALFAAIGALGSLMLALFAPLVGTLGALGESIVLGALFGVVAAAIASVESLGVGAALAWPILGAGLTTAAVWPRLRRASAVCEELPRRRRLLASLSMRSHALPDRGPLYLDDGTSVEREGGDVLWTASEPLAVEGRSVTGTAMVVNGDHVRVGAQMYRFREIR